LGSGFRVWFRVLCVKLKVSSFGSGFRVKV